MAINPNNLEGMLEKQAIEYASEHGNEIIVVQRDGFPPFFLDKGSHDANAIYVKVRNGKVYEII